MGETRIESKSWTSRLGRLMKGGKGRGGQDDQRENGDTKSLKEPRKLQKQVTPQFARPASSRQEGINDLGEREYSIFSDSTTLADSTDGVRDHTEMLHGLANRDSSDTIRELAWRQKALDEDDPEVIAMRKKQEAMLAAIPVDIWELIEAHLDPSDRVHLALTNKNFFAQLGTQALTELNLPENRSEKCKCLRYIDHLFPDHLLCFVCARYHLRTNPGAETLPTVYSENPVFDCPSAKKSIMPRTRVAHPHKLLPYAFVQLVMRAARYGPAYGIRPETLSRGWKDQESGWTHRTLYQVNHGHLLMRVRSWAFAPPMLTPTGMRHLLYERDEYLPYFSVCDHWKDGVLMEVCKCALGHVPAPPVSLVDQLKKGPHWAASQLVHGRGVGDPLCRECNFCQSGRRCPLCASEYLVKVSLMEDRTDPVQRFKYAIVVTRWCDLGDGTGPGISPEWDAMNGVKCGYKSFDHVGRRSMMGVFESKISGIVPGVGLRNMNPGKTEGRAHDEWY
ncbi:hypothetical protein SLS53_002514 [Cytospora paraplurivora]|uniref:F-box domain-containing protein n=1 Tax=Cytospora paraplurivora TaxID=2898453 RepID=A0AAN9UFH6_9PEZI